MKEKFISIKSKKVIVACVTLACLVFAIGYASFFFQNASKKPHGFITLEGIPAQIQIDAWLEQPGREADVLLLSPDKTILTPKITGLRAPYRVNASLKTPQGKYHDLTLNVGKDRKSFGILADGFSPHDEITMTLDETTIYKNIRMDWSGRIELNTDLPKNKAANACIRINGHEKSIGLCHKIEVERPT